ncbi:MAG: BrnA antitoxin family protein [Terracidiphilus sp.]
MSTEDIKSRQWTERERKALRSAAKAQAVGHDAGLDFAAIPRLTEEQLAHLVRLRGARRKVAVSVRLDPQVLDWLRSKGEGHLTRINDILANLMEHERSAGSES